MVETMLRKEKQYKDGIKQNQELAQSLADRVAHGGPLESLLENVAEHRDRLKKLAENNVLQERKLHAFVQSLRNIVDDENVEDYQAALEKSMDTEEQKIARTSVEVTQERMYLDICSKLGEGQTGSGVAGDDDLEVLATGDSTVNLNCPFMTTLMVDPVKNKVCGHSYSKEAILNHIRKSRSPSCPVAGCSNRHVTQEQLEDDRETARLIRREQVRQQHQQRQLTQNALDADLDDDM